METPTKSGVLKNSTNIDFFTFANSVIFHFNCLSTQKLIKKVEFPQNADTSKCPTNLECKNLPISCLKCDFDESCTYGKEIQVNCNVNSNIMCTVSDFHYKKSFLDRKLIILYSAVFRVRKNSSAVQSVVIAGKRKIGNISVNWKTIAIRPKSIMCKWNVYDLLQAQSCHWINMNNHFL